MQGRAHGMYFLWMTGKCLQMCLDDYNSIIDATVGELEVLIIKLYVNLITKEFENIIFSGRKVRGEAEVGEQTAWEAAEGHCSGVSRGLCVVNNGEEASNVCAVQSRPEGKDEED